MPVQPLEKQGVDAVGIFLVHEVARTLDSLHRTADVLLLLDRHAEAELPAAEALKGYRNTLGNEHSSTVKTAKTMARIYEVIGKADEASALRREFELEGVSNEPTVEP